MYDKSTHGVPAMKLPAPRGYKMLIYVPDVQEKTSGGVYIPGQTLEKEKLASVVGQIISLGPDAYADTEKFRSPYCKEGDWVMFHSYSGTRFKVDGKDFRLINDDTVEAVVEDPGCIQRA